MLNLVKFFLSKVTTFQQTLRGRGFFSLKTKFQQCFPRFSFTRNFVLGPSNNNRLSKLQKELLPLSFLQSCNFDNFFPNFEKYIKNCLVIIIIYICSIYHVLCLSIIIPFNVFKISLKQESKTRKMKNKKSSTFKNFLESNH